MGEIDRAAAAKRFEDALEQFQETLIQESLDPLEAPGVPEPPQSPAPPDPALPLETKLLRRLRSPQRDKQLAAMEAAIADLEAFLNTNPSPQVIPDTPSESD